MNIYLFLLPEQGDLESLKRSLNCQSGIFTVRNAENIFPVSVIKDKPEDGQFLAVLFFTDMFYEVKMIEVLVEDGIIVIR